MEIFVDETLSALHHSCLSTELRITLETNHCIRL